jgi:hypothetical protein
MPDPSYNMNTPRNRLVNSLASRTSRERPWDFPWDFRRASWDFGGFLFPFVETGLSASVSITQVFSRGWVVPQERFELPTPSLRMTDWPISHGSLVFPSRSEAIEIS